MSIVKSLSVDNGDTYYIRHNSDNFTIIDCNLSDENKETLVAEMKEQSKDKSIHRFISTHPDEDHFHGLAYLEENEGITNFYCVKNSTTKSDETDDFKKYCELRDGDKAFHLYKGCSRKRKNVGCKDRGSAGLMTLRPDTDNEAYKDALKIAEEGGSPNNISIVMKYSIENGPNILWMGDLENDFMEKILDEIEFPKINILFAPHHGRKSGKVPKEWLQKMNPDIIVMGQAPSANLDYASYSDYNKITQNGAGDITFDCSASKIDIYTSNENYSVDFLVNDYLVDNEHGSYIGSLYI